MKWFKKRFRKWFRKWLSWVIKALSLMPTYTNVQDFSWDEQGFSVMSRFYADMSLLLDDKFRTAKHMTYNYRGDSTRSVDTSPFRRAIWNYTQSLYGMLEDDYDYEEVRVHLEPSLQQFIRASCTTPTNMHTHLIHATMLDLSTSEKVHVKILIMEAKRQALLLYAMRAVTHHMM
jgi:sestrin